MFQLYCKVSVQTVFVQAGLDQMVSLQHAGLLGMVHKALTQNPGDHQLIHFNSNHMCTAPTVFCTRAVNTSPLL